MKTTKKERSRDISPEGAMKQLQEIFKERGSKALEIAREEALKEEITSKEASEALAYFMIEYWHDLARPSLLSFTSEAVGGDPKAITPLAVPMILMSGAIDIHDDIIDQSKTKSGRPTVYGKFGKDIALLVGDALIFKGFTLLHEAPKKGVPAQLMPTIINIIKETFFELGDAEALELSLRGRINISPEEYLHVIQKKAADVEAHTRIGAILGSATEKEVELLGDYGRLLGMMLILRDDWIDVVDLEESRHRVKNECLPLPMIYALQNAEVKPRLNSVLLKRTITERDALLLLEATHEIGALDQFQELFQRLAQDAYSKLTIFDKQHYLKLLVDATALELSEKGES